MPFFVSETKLKNCSGVLSTKLTGTGMKKETYIYIQLKICQLDKHHLCLERSPVRLEQLKHALPLTDSHSFFSFCDFVIREIKLIGVETRQGLCPS